jgi:hypothetical protein
MVWLLSDKMKSVLTAVDPDAFTFVRCELFLRDGSLGPTYWLCDVMCTLDALDEESSDVGNEFLPGDIKSYNLIPISKVSPLQPQLGASRKPEISGLRNDGTDSSHFLAKACSTSAHRLKHPHPARLRRATFSRVKHAGEGTRVDRRIDELNFMST